MSTRDFSVIRRRPNFVDILTPKRSGVEGYRFLAASTFNGPFTLIFTASASSGHLDSTIDRMVINVVNNKDHVRVVFDPDNYAAIAGIDDAKHVWIQFQTIDPVGVLGIPGPPTLILPDDERASATTSIRGVAPSGADIGDSITINFPYGMREVTLHNEENATPLFVSMTQTGPEVRISSGDARVFRSGLVSGLTVRGGGAAAVFTATMSNYSRP
jgi:hypothetical protein